jgi:hypothetical protein
MKTKEEKIMLTYFGIWCEGSSIENCYFVTQDYDECLKLGTDMMVGFITSGPDDDQRVQIRGVDIGKRQFNKLLKCVDTPDFELLDELYEDSECVMEFNYSDRDEFYYTSGGGFEDEEPDYENPRYDNPDFETNVRYYVEQIVEMNLNGFNL